MSADDSSLPTHEEYALAVFSFDSDDRLALLRHLGEDHLSDRAELELGRILAFYVISAPRRLQVGLRDFRTRVSFPLPRPFRLGSPIGSAAKLYRPGSCVTRARSMRGTMRTAGGSIVYF
jgi:hypothetical protein